MRTFLAALLILSTVGSVFGPFLIPKSTLTRKGL